MVRTCSFASSGGRESKFENMAYEEKKREPGKLYTEKQRSDSENEDERGIGV